MCLFHSPLQRSYLKTTQELVDQSDLNQRPRILWPSFHIHLVLKWYGFQGHLLFTLNKR